MLDSSTNNKRIAQNTVFLYLRMAVTMVVQFYAARVVLNTLGVDDFGIYNVVGGVIVLFSFLNNAMSTTSQRFISYAIGDNSNGNVAETFNTSIYCHIFIAIIIFVLGESVGLWFFLNKLVIPLDRQNAAMWVYQISIINAVINIVRVPYNALIVSYEKMSFYAYVSILEALLKLVIVFFIVLSPIDKLITYAILLLVVSIVLFAAYYCYCRVKFPECRWRYGFDDIRLRKMLSYSGLSMLSSGVSMANLQGGNMMLNIFFGVVYNAAYGIANQISNAIYMFVSNFQMAFQPQIVKLYAANETIALKALIYRSSILSFFLLLIIAVPFCLEANWFLIIWLGTPPEYADVFCVLLVAYFLIDAIQAPLWMLIGATGDIKTYTYWSTGVILFNLPIAYVILINGGGVIWVFAIRVILNIICALIRVPFVRRFVDIPVKEYFLKVAWPALLVTTVSVSLSLLIKFNINNNFLSALFITLVTGLTICLLGIDKNDRKYVISMIKSKLHRSNV